jgi:hypothetical protein
MGGVPASNLCGIVLYVVFSKDTERLHLLEERRLAVEDADPRGTAELVPRKGVEVAVEILNVHPQMRCGLRAVEQHRHAALASGGDHRLDRIDRPQRIRDVREADQARATGEKAPVFVEVELAALRDRHHAKPRALFLRDHLPRYDVRMVLECREDDLVAFADELAPVAVGDQVDRVGRAAREDHLARFACVHEALHLFPRRLVLGGRLLGKIMYRTVDIRVLARLVAHQPVDHRLRHLARGCVVQEDERLSLHRKLKDREIGADALDIKGAALSNE